VRPLSLPPLHRFADLAPLVLRLGIGLVFVVHGWAKLTEGPSGFAGMLTGLNVPAPELFAWLTMIAELVGGLLLLAGFLTRLATLPLIAVMTGALLLVKSSVGIIAPMGSPMPGAELDIALLSGLVALLLLGPGRLSVDHALGVEAEVRTAEQPVAVRR
jgi:putative oxidoreductase